MLLRGTSRIRRAPPAENGVWMSDGIVSFEISECMYRERRYSPPLERLPWKARPNERRNTGENRAANQASGR